MKMERLRPWTEALLGSSGPASFPAWLSGSRVPLVPPRALFPLASVLLCWELPTNASRPLTPPCGDRKGLTAKHLAPANPQVPSSALQLEQQDRDLTLRV